MESESQGRYVPVCDQPIINGRGSTPLDLGTSYDANMQNASERPS